jgi:hypothetical protein
MTRQSSRGQRAGQGLDPLELALGHAGVVLEGHRQDALAAVGVADEPGEARDGADVGATGGEAGELEARLERFGLDADHRQPPVTGGKNATSRAPASLAEGSAWVWSMAQRTTPWRRRPRRSGGGAGPDGP